MLCAYGICDFPTYGLFIGYVTKGLVGCPPCGPTIKPQSSKKLKKNIFVGIIVICQGFIPNGKLELLSMGK